MPEQAMKWPNPWRW